MITYELAKQLKEAGFPYSNRIGDIIENGTTGEKCISPTLSELIEACGDDFLVLAKHDNGGYIAGDTMRGWDDGTAWVGEDMKLGEPYDEFHGKGSTPEEAVANFWLAINKK